MRQWKEVVRMAIVNQVNVVISRGRGVGDAVELGWSWWDKGRPTETGWSQNWLYQRQALAMAMDDERQAQDRWNLGNFRRMSWELKLG